MNWLALTLAAALLLQSGNADRASIQGFVVKLGTAEPVAKAVVTLSAFSGGRNQTFSATTGADGQFAFQNLEPGQYRLSATRDGYIRSEYGARSPNRPGLPVNVAAGQRVNQLVLPLMPAGTITGRVFARDGEPLANVNVQAHRYTYQGGERVLNPVQQARTNDLGEYRLFWLQPGTYYISATPAEGQRGALLAAAAAIAGPGIGGRLIEAIGARGGARGQPAADAKPEEGYVPVFYPGTMEPDSAAPIQLPPGIVFSGVDLTVAPVRTLRVRGQVINGTTGQPARNANVMLVPRQRAAGRGIRPDFMSRNNAQGQFEIAGVPPGSYDLVGILNERSPQVRYSARIPLEIGNSDVENVTLLISPGFPVTGRLAIEGQAGTGGQELSRMRVNLRPDAPIMQAAGAPPATAVQADGTFTLQQVGRDEYRLAITGMPRNGYVKMARLGGIDVLNQGLRLDRAPDGPLEILVSTNTGVADGIVQNDKQEPSANVTVVLVPDAAHRSRLDLYRTTSTNAMGRFHLEGVPPGDYRVFAWEDVEPGAWQDPDFIRQFEDRGKPVRINEGGTQNIELRVIPSQV